MSFLSHPLFHQQAVISFQEKLFLVLEVKFATGKTIYFRSYG